MRHFQGNALVPVQNKAHTKMSSYSTLPWAQPPELISPPEKGALQMHPCGLRQAHIDTDTVPKPQNTPQPDPTSELQWSNSCQRFLLLPLFVVGAEDFFVIFFIIAPSFLINKALTLSNCPGISIASSPHDLSTLDSNFILTVPKLQRNTMMLSHSWETQTEELNYLPMVKDHGCVEPCGSTLDHRDMLHYH